MRIVLLHYFPTGANPVYSELTAALRSLGHEVYMAEACRDGSLVYKTAENTEIRVAGPRSVGTFMSRIPIISGLLGRLHFLGFVRSVRHSLSELSPDIVQVNPFDMAWLLPLLSPRNMHFVLDIRQINEAVDSRLSTKVSEHTSILRKKIWARYFFEKTCFCHQEAARRILGGDWAKWAEVVPVGVDLGFLQQPVSNVRHGDNGAVTFVYVGTLSRLRNLENIMHAAKLLMGRTKKFRIDFIGPDKSQGYYPSVVDELGIGSCVSIKPAIAYSDVPYALAQYDVGLANTPDRPTWHYQPTIKVLEYRALGMPIISTDVASHREIVENKVNGILCGDKPRQIADAMQAFTSDLSFLQQVQSNASKMRTGRSWLDIAKLYIENVYAGLIAGNQ